MTGGAGRPELDRAVETWTQMGDASVLRSVAAVVLGFAVLTFGSVIAGQMVIALTGVDAPAGAETPPLGRAFIATTLGSRLLVAVLAGLLAALAAPRAPRLHAGVLAAILLFFSLATLLGQSHAPEAAPTQAVGPDWYPFAMSVIGPAGVLAGGALRHMAQSSRTGGRPSPPSSRSRST